MVHELEIRFASKYSVIRDSTVRKNLGYVVKRFDAKYTTRNTMKANIIQQINLAAIQERLILFCRSIAMVNEFQDLFNSLNPSIYHSDLTDEQRQENVDSWKSGASKLIIATSGFGAGVDYSNVKYVHHW
jgi:superfamily II DNA helicase RecQ